MDVQKTENAVGGEFFFSTETFGICDVSPAMLAALKGESGPEKRIEAKREILRYMNKIGRATFDDIAEVFLKRRNVRLFSFSPSDYVAPDNIEEWSENLSLFKGGNLPDSGIEKIWLRLCREAEKEFVQCGENEKDRQTFGSHYRHALKSFFAAFKGDRSEETVLKMLFPDTYFLRAAEKIEGQLYDKEIFEAVMSPMMEAMQTSDKFSYCEVFICRKMVEMHSRWGEGRRQWEERFCTALSKYADPFKITAVTSDPDLFLNFKFLRRYLKIEQEISGQSDLRAWLRDMIHAVGSVEEIRENRLFESYARYTKILEVEFKQDDSEEGFNLLLADLDEFIASVILTPEATTSPLGGLLAEAATEVIAAAEEELEKLINSPEIIDQSEAIERLRACMKARIRAEFSPVLTAASFEEPPRMYQETTTKASPS